MEGEGGQYTEHLSYYANDFSQVKSLGHQSSEHFVRARHHYLVKNILPGK
jgi:hypothetical protein